MDGMGIDEIKKTPPKPMGRIEFPGKTSTPNDPLIKTHRLSQVDALEDQKDRLTNGLEKLRVTSEQATNKGVYEVYISVVAFLKYLGGIFIPNLGCICFKWVGEKPPTSFVFEQNTQRMVGFVLLGMRVGWLMGVG